MKKFIIYSLALIGLFSCKDQYLDDYYVEPVAAFSTNLEGTEAGTLESIIFTNLGAGQTFSIWTGDANHQYGKQGNSGFAIGTSGEFSYSYREPGQYTVVWIASSMNAAGEIISSIDSVKLTLLDKSGGLDNLSIYKIYRMDDYDDTRSTYFHAAATMLDDSTLMCPIIYEAWRNGSINSIKSKKLYLKYQLTSTTATLYWYTDGDWKNVRSEVDNFFGVMDGNTIAPQRIKVVTASGFTRYFQINAVMMPKLTSMTFNGVEATITHDLSAYNIYDVNVTLPAGTDLTQLKPEFVLMENDANLLDGSNASVTVNGVEQTSGVSVVDFSNGVVTYNLEYTMLGATNKELKQTSEMRVNITLE